MDLVYNLKKLEFFLISLWNLGGKLALAMGCYHAERVTGVFSLDSAPLDHRYHESFRELKGVVDFARNMNLNRGKPEIEVEMKEKVLVRTIFGNRGNFKLNLIF